MDKNKRSQTRSGNEESPKQQPSTKISIKTDLVEIHNQAFTPQIQDIITEDGILCSILSNLTLREAVRTSVLSPRWRHIWTHIPTLNFRVSNIFDAQTYSLLDDNSLLTVDEKLKLLEEKRDQFVLAVDSIMKQHQSHDGVDNFYVRYFIRETHFHYLDSWIRFAISSKTKILGLHLNKTFHTRVEGDKYEFHLPPLGSSSSLEELVLMSCSLILPPEFNGLSRLKTLRLYDVDVTEEDIIRLLSNCYTLEHLRIQAVQRVVTLTIPHPQNRLRGLVVKHCYKCRQLKINAVNLNKLYFYGYPANFILTQSSQITEVCIVFITEYVELNLNYYLNKLSINLPHICSLSFTINGPVEVLNLPKESKSFNHLRRLDWCWNAKVKMSLIHLATILDASPMLEEFNFQHRTECTFEQPPQRLKKLKEMLPNHPHYHLKTIGIRDFYCDKLHIEFGLFLLKNAIKLGSMTIRPRNLVLDETHIENLRQEVPAEVMFTIL